MSEQHEWEILADYGYGYDVVFTAITKPEGLSILIDYRNNAPEGRYQIKRVRV